MITAPPTERDGDTAIHQPEIGNADPKLHFAYVDWAADAAAAEDRLSTDTRRDNLYVTTMHANRSLTRNGLASALRERRGPVDRVAAVLTCAAARSARVTSIRHNGKWTNMDHLHNLAHLPRVKQHLVETGFQLRAGAEVLVKLTGHPTNPLIGRLSVTTHLLDAYNPEARLGSRRSKDHFTAPRLVRLSSVDTYAVNLPVLIQRLDQLGLLDAACELGELPVGEAVNSLLGLKAVGDRDSTILVPAASSVRIAQLFGDLTPVAKPSNGKVR